MDKRNPILVTGAHRSGTTWVGKMISACPEVCYIHEPFNVQYPPPIGICGVRFPRWFTYVTDENGAAYEEPIKRMVSFQYNFLKAVRSRRRVDRTLGEFRRFLKHRYLSHIALLKDPIALFSAEWLAKTFRMNLIILIRHPAAITSSLKELNWRFSFSPFLQQPLLMRDHLYRFEAEMIDQENNPNRNVVDEAILLYKIIHHMIIKYRRCHKDWIFIRHEDISREPIANFKYVFQRLRLDFTSSVRKVIEEHTDCSNPSDPDDRFYLKRNSRQNIWNWKKRLSESEIREIKEKTESIWRTFYSDAEW